MTEGMALIAGCLFASWITGYGLGWLFKLTESMTKDAFDE